jgi:ribonuclease HI
VLADGQRKTKDGSVCLKDATAKKAALMALSDALARFTKAAVIKIYISDDFVRNMLIANMPQRWEQNDWKKIRGNKDLKNETQWKYIKGFLSDHAVSYAKAAEVSENKTLKEMEWRMNSVGGKQRD